MSTTPNVKPAFQTKPPTMVLITSPAVYNPSDYPNKPAVFLAGGISGCPDWQKSLHAFLIHLNDECVLLNPRRVLFDETVIGAKPEQIVWEHRHLQKADAISFWFPEETLCPITLFELGKWLQHGSKKIFIGCHPKYARKLDVIVQTALCNPNILVVNSLEELTTQITTWVRNTRRCREQEAEECNYDPRLYACNKV